MQYQSWYQALSLEMKKLFMKTMYLRCITGILGEAARDEALDDHPTYTMADSLGSHPSVLSGYQYVK